jgi:hypothetical protein
MNVVILKEGVPCLQYVNLRFERTFHIYLQGRKSAKQETSVQQNLKITCCTLVSFSADFQPWWWFRNVGSHNDYTALYPGRWQHSSLGSLCARTFWIIIRVCTRTSHSSSQSSVRFCSSNCSKLQFVTPLLLPPYLPLRLCYVFTFSKRPCANLILNIVFYPFLVIKNHNAYYKNMTWYIQWYSSYVWSCTM